MTMSLRTKILLAILISAGTLWLISPLAFWITVSTVFTPLLWWGSFSLGSSKKDPEDRA